MRSMLAFWMGGASNVGGIVVVIQQTHLVCAGFVRGTPAVAGFIRHDVAAGEVG